jgi:hypothetical protein
MKQSLKKIDSSLCLQWQAVPFYPILQKPDFLPSNKAIAIPKLFFAKAGKFWNLRN